MVQKPYGATSQKTAFFRARFVLTARRLDSELTLSETVDTFPVYQDARSFAAIFTATRP
jgi:hypothetical protein